MSSDKRKRGKESGGEEEKKEERKEKVSRRDGERKGEDKWKKSERKEEAGAGKGKAIGIKTHRKGQKGKEREKEHQILYGKSKPVTGQENNSQISDRISSIWPCIPDIWYPVFGLAGYPARRLSIKSSIRCIHYN